MRSGDWIVRLGIGATVFISFAAGAEERPSMRETVGCHAAAQLMVPKDTSSLFEFRDVFRPNSEEAAKHEYEPIAWGTQERELVLSRLRILFGGQTRGLLDRAAADGALSLYRAKLTGFAQAKGGYLRLTLDGTAFPKPGYDWLSALSHTSSFIPPTHTTNLAPIPRGMHWLSRGLRQRAHCLQRRV
jgi:hypothetical protein